MKQIYFSGNKNNIFKKGLKATLSYSTSALDRALPALSLIWAERMLCTPTRSKNPPPQASEGFQSYAVSVYGHDVQVYTQGDLSRAILFVHGWSGAANNFQAFYEPFLKAGYGIIAFDHVAHGESGGKTANLFLYIRGIEAVMNWATARGAQFAGAVGHSMGGTALISTLDREFAKLPVFLIAPVIPIFESLYASTANFGISPSWVNRLLEVFEMRYGLIKEKVDPTRRIQKLFNPLRIVQDKGDTYISLTNNQKYLPERYSEVIQTENLGHFRILKAPQVVENAVQFFGNA